MEERANAGIRGFTLIEILVVLCIMALLLGLLPRLGVGLERARLRGAADEAAAFLIRAHTAALTSGDLIAVAVDPASKVISSLRSRLQLKQVVREVVVLKETRLGSGDGQLQFYPDGSADGARLRLFSEHAEEDVTIDWVTGHVARSRR